jgi:hypothetical protein
MQEGNEELIKKRKTRKFRRGRSMETERND